MRRLIFAVLLSFVLLGSHHAAAQTGPDYACTADKKFSFPEMAALVKEKGCPAKLPVAYAKRLGFGDSDIPTIRFSLAWPAEDKFIAMEIIPGSPDYLLFHRIGRKIIFWRLDRAGKTIRTNYTRYVSTQNDVVPNSRFASTLTEACEMLFDFLPRPREELECPR